jgi:hypothetical protein
LVLGWKIRELGFNSQLGKYSFLFSTMARLFGVHLAFCSVVTGALSPEIKRQGPEADHPLPSSSDFKNTSILPYILMV